MLGPDEPRYAAIGREMAESGDWVTPRLWGEPWFEKPALLYWMTAAGFKSGLGEDLAPRLPVAAMSVAFLVFYGLWLRREFGGAAAWYATLMLGTGAGWIAFSHLGVTDLPLTVTFSAAMLLCFPLITSGDRRIVVPAGILFGLAVLAKGLVPVPLAMPLVWFGRKRWKELLGVAGVALLTAAPWYVLCTIRNGTALLEELIGRHTLERFYSESLQHVQPFWFYAPVLLAGIVPWTPVLGKLFRRELYGDVRMRFLLGWLLFGFVFLSASTNKLPGYLLPLLPALSALMGVAIDRAARARWTLGACALLLVLIPAAATVLPVAVRDGLSRATLSEPPWLAIGGCLTLAVLVWRQDTLNTRRVAVEAIALALIVGVVLLKSTTLPVMDRAVSARDLWRQIEPRRELVCVEEIHRAWQYGLNYYAMTPLPVCTDTAHALHVRQAPGEPAVLE